MKVYKGVSASPGLVLGQVSRLEHHVETFSHGPFNPERELRLLANAVHTAQNELDSMAERAAPTEQAIFLFQSMMLDDEGMMNEVRFCINAGISASAAMHQVGQRYADQLANMKDNPYMQLRSVDILDATRRVINILTNRPRVWLALDHPVILAADRLMPTDLFSVPSGMILGVITAEGSGQSHAAIIARAMNIPGIVQVGKDFLDDCDGRTVILDATNGNCILDPDAAARQQAEASICQLQREDAEMKQLHSLPDETRDGEPFELLANCFGPEDIDTAMQSGAKGVGLLRSGYMMLPGRILDEQEQYFFYCSCLAAANGCPVTVRTFDFGSDRTVADANQGPQSSKLGLRGIRNSLLVSALSALLSVYFSALTAYGIHAYDFKFKKLAFTFILLIMMMPTQVSALGFVRLITKMGMADTLAPLFLPSIAAPVVFYFMLQYMEGNLPMEIVEAARIDGSGEFSTFNRIVLPILKPALAVQAIFTFVNTWNNYFTPALVLSSSGKKTLPILIAQLRSADFLKFDMGQVYVMIAFSIFPVIVVYLILSKHIVQGVALGSVKG